MMPQLLACYIAGGVKTGCTVTLTGTQNASDIVTDPADASASISTTGTLVFGTASGSTAWRTDTACENGLYEVEMVITSGSNPDSGSTYGSGTWNNIGASWTWNQTVVGSKLATFTLTIREKADVSNTGSCTGNIEATVDPPE